MGLAALSLILAGLLAAPTVWSAYPAWANTAADLPIVGTQSGGPGGGAGGGGAVSVNTQLIAYLEANQGSATYLVAVPTSNESAPIIITTGKAVMTLGGFNGSDPILTTSQLQTLIKDGTVRYFLLSGNGGGGQGGGPRRRPGDQRRDLMGDAELQDGHRERVWREWQRVRRVRRRGWWHALRLLTGSVIGA